MNEPIKTTWISIAKPEKQEAQKLNPSHKKRVTHSYASGKKDLFELIHANPGITSKEAKRRLGWTNGRFEGVLRYFISEIYSNGLVLKADVHQSKEAA
jgi:hypothetical protein